MRAVNLIPSERRAGAGGAGRSGGAAYLLLAGLAGLLLMGVLYVMASHQTADRRAALVSANREADAAQARATALAPYTQLASLRTQRVQDISTLAAQRIDWPTHLRDLTAALPLDVRLLTVDATAAAAGTGAVPPSPAAPTGSPAHPTSAATTSGAAGPGAQVTGCATSQTEVASVINRLRGVPGVVAVNLGSSQKGQGATAGAGSSGGGAAGSPCGDPNRSPQFALTVSFAPTGAPAGVIPPASGPAPRTPTGVPTTGATPTPVSAPPATATRVPTSATPAGAAR